MTWIASLAAFPAFVLLIASFDMMNGARHATATGPLLRVSLIILVTLPCSGNPTT